MTFFELLKEYDQSKEIVYPSDYYNDMRKKLLVAFECLGLYDLTIFKAENGKDYSFLEETKEYIFYLLNSETSPLFRKIKGNKMELTDYADLALEVEKLFEFIKPYTKTEDEYRKIITDISTNVRYPILERYKNIRGYYGSLFTYFESLITDEGDITQIPNWLFLTDTDKLRLLDELISATTEWVNLACKLGEFRADEQTDLTFDLPIEKFPTYIMVENAIVSEYCEAYKDLPFKKIGNSRSFRAEKAKLESNEDLSCNLKLSLAEKYCNEHGIDFLQYKAEKKLFESTDSTPLSTDAAFEAILNEK